MARRLPALLAIALLAALPGAPPRAEPSAYQVIVHPANRADSVESRFLQDAFLKRATKWPDGSPIEPVDLRADSSVRERFSESVLGRTVAAVRSYWQQLVFSGRDVPPPELESDQEVIAFVLRNPGAIGYVSASTDIDGARSLKVE